MDNKEKVELSKSDKDFINDSKIAAKQIHKDFLENHNKHMAEIYKFRFKILNSDGFKA